MRRVWFALDTGFMTDPKVEALGVKFGAAGPLALVVMMGAAKLQDEPDGQFTLTWTGVKDGAFLRSEKLAREIVLAATGLDGVRLVKKGDLPLLVVLDESKRSFVAYFNGWSKWQRQSDSASKSMALHRNKPLRDAIHRRDNDMCRYCGTVVNWNDRRGATGGTYDRVIPSGPVDESNVVACCRACSSRKGERTPEEAAMELLAPPGSRAESDLDLSTPTGTGTDTEQQGSDRSVVSPIRSDYETFGKLRDETDRGAA